MELCISQSIRTKPNICIYLESIGVALSYQAQKDLINFKHYEQCHSTDNTNFCPRIENIRTGHFCSSCSQTKKAAGLKFLHSIVYGLDLSKGIARAEIFFAGLKKNRVRTDSGRTLVAYSTIIIIIFVTVLYIFVQCVGLARAPVLSTLWVSVHSTPESKLLSYVYKIRHLSSHLCIQQLVYACTFTCHCGKNPGITKVGFEFWEIL